MIVITESEYKLLSKFVTGERFFGQQLVPEFKRGTLYVMLKDLQNKALLTSTQERLITAIGLPKRVYMITDLGKRVWEVYTEFIARLESVCP